MLMDYFYKKLNHFKAVKVYLNTAYRLIKAGFSEMGESLKIFSNFF